jgi:integrase
MGLYRRPNSAVWWMTFTYEGKTIRQSTKTRHKKQAEQIWGNIQTQLIEDRWFNIDQLKRRKLREMIDKFDRDCSSFKDYYQSKRDRSIFKHLYAYFGEDATLKQVAERVGEYELFRRRAEKPASPATIMKELSLLRRMFNVARKQWKWKLSNPVSDIELPKVRNDRVRYLSNDELQRLFKVLQSGPEWLWHAVALALGTGLRLGNVATLQWSEVSFSDRMIIIDAAKMKNETHLGIPIRDSVMKVLRIREKMKISDFVLHDGGQPFYAVKIQRAFKAALKTARIKDFHWHDLRHCFCSYMRQKGVDLHTVSVLVGHRDQRMTQRYSHLNVESLRSAIEKVDFTFLSQSDVGLKAETV